MHSILSVLLRYGTHLDNLLALSLLLAMSLDLLLYLFESLGICQFLVCPLIYLLALLLKSEHVVKNLILIYWSIL